MRGIVLVAVLAAAAGPLAAQDARLTRLDPSLRARVVPVVDSVRAAGLPTEPLVDKALEGASKRASGDRIVDAVRTLAGDLGAARAALGRTAREPELVAGAAAIRAGATGRDLSRLRAERRGSLTIPLAVMANLMARGVPRDTAALVVIALAQRGAPDDEFTELQRDVERDIGAGASPAAAASVRGRGRGGAASGDGPGRSGDAPGRGGQANPGGGRGNQGAPPGQAKPGGGRGNQGQPPPQANPGRGRGSQGNPPDHANPGGRGRGRP